MDGQLCKRNVHERIILYFETLVQNNFLLSVLKHLYDSGVLKGQF
jgi:hypothetical protein